MVRICLDARRLNEAMVGDRGCPPIIEDLLQGFNGATTIDITSSYWQIPLYPESTKYVAFLYNGKSYTFQRLPFGLKTLVGSFSRCMDIVLGKEVQGFTCNYIVDNLVFSPHLETHLLHLEKVFERLKRANLTINIAKLQFIRSHQIFWTCHID